MIQQRCTIYSALMLRQLRVERFPMRARGEVDVMLCRDVVTGMGPTVQCCREVEKNIRKFISHIED